MKRVLMLMLFVGTFALAITGCAKKEEAPAEGAATEAPAEGAPAEAAPH